MIVSLSGFRERLVVLNFSLTALFIDRLRWVEVPKGVFDTSLAKKEQTAYTEQARPFSQKNKAKDSIPINFN